MNKTNKKKIILKNYINYIIIYSNGRINIIYKLNKMYEIYKMT